MKRLRRESGGMMAVEFAIIAPILLLFLVGAIELSRALWVKQELQFAVEEAARYGLANSAATNSTLVTYAQNKLSDIAATDPNLHIAAAVSTSSVTVTATYSFTFVATQFLNLVGSGNTPLGTFILTATSQTPK